MDQATNSQVDRLEARVDAVERKRQRVSELMARVRSLLSGVENMVIGHRAAVEELLSHGRRHLDEAGRLTKEVAAEMEQLQADGAKISSQNHE